LKDRKKAQRMRMEGRPWGGRVYEGMGSWCLRRTKDRLSVLDFFTASLFESYIHQKWVKNQTKNKGLSFIYYVL
jgi:hypothetical protein